MPVSNIAVRDNNRDFAQSMAVQYEKVMNPDLKRPAESKNIILKYNCKYAQIPVDSILYLEVLNHNLTVHTILKDYTVRMTFSQIFEKLPPSRFARCHKSYAVNLARISHFSRTEGVTLDCHVTLPLGKKYFDEFWCRFAEFTGAC